MADFYETCLSADFVLLKIEENAKEVTKVIEIFSCLLIVFYVAIVSLQLETTHTQSTS